MRAVLQLRRCCLSEGVVEGLLASRPNVSARTEESMRLVYMSISYQLLGVLAHRVQQIAWTGNWSMEERLEDFEENYEHDAKTRWTRATRLGVVRWSLLNILTRFVQRASLVRETLISWIVKFPGLKRVGSSNKYLGVEQACTRKESWLGGCLKSLREEEVVKLMNRLGDDGVLSALGMSKTIGSVMKTPPYVGDLIHSFNKPHEKDGRKMTLTVGAKALAKHAVRSSDGWWGQIIGNDASKNRQAEQKLEQILKDAVWANTHLLPNDIEIFELRVREGFGARWSADGKEFRGFLEPLMEDGHEKGWRH